MVYSDSHCHLEADTPENVAKLVEDAKKKSVGIIVSLGMDIETSAETVQIAESYDRVWAGVGVHPWKAVLPSTELQNALSELSRKERVVLLGELGLDYVRTPETKEIQKELLYYQLSLTRETGLPISVHCRGAHEDLVSILHKEKGPDLRGVVHGFAGDRTQLTDWLDLNFYIGIGVRWFVYNEMSSLVAAVPEIPLDRLLIETDSSARARRARESAGPVDVCLVAEKIAALRRTTVEEIANASTANLKQFLNIQE